MNWYSSVFKKDAWVMISHYPDGHNDSYVFYLNINNKKLINK